MRKFILITTMVLVSATAQAGGLRGLTLASNDEPAAAAPTRATDTKATDTNAVDIKPVDVKPAETQPTETPKYVDGPSAVDGKAADPCPCAGTASTDAPKDTIKTVKPKRRHESTEARVIYELHRHGIYW